MNSTMAVDPEDYILPDEEHVRWEENLTVAASAFIGFWALFACSWHLSSARIPEFKAFTSAEKADWCSRINSTVHALTVVIGVGIALSAITWGEDFLPMSSITPANVIFSIAIGYFACDLIVIIAWPVDMQTVFITHHIVALVPYLINNFVSCCGASQFGLLLFLLVELATLPLNVRGFLEAIGRQDTKYYRRAIYTTYVIWGISRALLPIFLIYVFWAYAFPSDRNHDVCLYTNLVGAHAIALFCVGVFIFVHTPEVIRLKKEAIKSEDARPKTPRARETDDSYDNIESGVQPTSAREVDARDVLS